MPLKAKERRVSHRRAGPWSCCCGRGKTEVHAMIQGWLNPQPPSPEPHLSIPKAETKSQRESEERAEQGKPCTLAVLHFSGSGCLVS